MENCFIELLIGGGIGLAVGFVVARKFPKLFRGNVSGTFGGGSGGPRLKE